jgi:hypothetical protein
MITVQKASSLTSGQVSFTFQRSLRLASEGEIKIAQER